MEDGQLDGQTAANAAEKQTRRLNEESHMLAYMLAGWSGETV